MTRITPAVLLREPYHFFGPNARAPFQTQIHFLLRKQLLSGLFINKNKPVSINNSLGLHSPQYEFIGTGLGTTSFPAPSTLTIEMAVCGSWEKDLFDLLQFTHLLHQQPLTALRLVLRLKAPLAELPIANYLAKLIYVCTSCQRNADISFWFNCSRTVCTLPHPDFIAELRLLFQTLQGVAQQAELNLAIDADLFPFCHPSLLFLLLPFFQQTSLTVEHLVSIYVEVAQQLTLLPADQKELLTQLSRNSCSSVTTSTAILQNTVTEKSSSHNPQVPLSTASSNPTQIQIGAIDASVTLSARVARQTLRTTGSLTPKPKPPILSPLPKQAEAHSTCGCQTANTSCNSNSCLCAGNESLKSSADNWPVLEDGRPDFAKMSSHERYLYHAQRIKKQLSF